MGRGRGAWARGVGAGRGRGACAGQCLSCVCLVFVLCLSCVCPVSLAVSIIPRGGGCTIPQKDL